MKTFERIEKATSFIEDNLDKNITITDVAAAADVSVFYFARLFKQTLGESIMEYIRKRRLTRASRELVKNLDKPIIEIAYDSGYDSQEAFTRAFLKVFNMTPARYRSRGVAVGVFERSRLDIKSLLHNNGIRENNPRLIELGALKIAGLPYLGNNAKGEVSALWQSYNKRCDEFQKFTRNPVCYGVCTITNNPDAPKGHFNYLAGCIIDFEEHIPPDLTQVELPPGSWLAFEHRGSLDRLFQTYEYIYTKYMPESDFEAEDVEIEVYDSRFEMDSPDSVMELWVRVHEKKDRKRMKNFMIRKLGEFTVVGLRYQGKNQSGEIPKMWDEFCGRTCEIPKEKLVNKNVSWGVCTVEENFTEGDEFDYYAGIEVEDGTPTPPGMVTHKIPAGTWAVFLHKGPIDTLGNTYHEIYTKHLPELGKQPDMIELELYDERFVFGSPKSIMEILVKIKE